MPDLTMICECGGRALLNGEALCPSCQRSQKSIVVQLQGAMSRVEQAGSVAGQAGTALLGKAVSHAKAGAQIAEEVAVPLMRTSVEAAKTRGTTVLKAALGQAEAGGEKALRAAVPFAERLLQRTKAYLDKRSG